MINIKSLFPSLKKKKKGNIEIGKPPTWRKWFHRVCTLRRLFKLWYWSWNELQVKLFPLSCPLMYTPRLYRSAYVIVLEKKIVLLFLPNTCASWQPIIFFFFYLFRNAHTVDNSDSNPNYLKRHKTIQTQLLMNWIPAQNTAGAELLLTTAVLEKPEILP